MNYKHKHLTKQKKIMNTNTQVHIEYLGEYVSNSIMLELTILNKRERGEGTH
jgi:hypothetical protein